MTMSNEERFMVLRDKAADIGVALPRDVADYLAERSDNPNDLKSSLINVASFARQRKRPISLELAKFYLDGVRLEGGIEALPTEVPDQKVLGSEEEEDLPEESASEPAPASPRTGEAAYETLELPLATPPAGFSSFQSEEPWAPEPSEHELKPPILNEPFEFEYGQPAGDVSGKADRTEEKPQSYAPPAPEPTPAPEPEPEPVAQPPLSVPVPVPVPQPATPTPVPRPAAPASFVQFAPMRTERKRSMVERVAILLKRAGIEEAISPGDKVAIKVHFGEQGNTAFVSPIYVREVVRLIKELGAKPFVTDANTLYSGMRTNAIDHIQCALENGFSYATIGAPIIIADGLDGHDATEVHIDGTHFETVKLGSAAIEADAMVVISHIKGHEMAGFGGALKNIGMGLGCRSAKQRMHSGVKPEVLSDKCINCGKCISWCNQHCIETRTHADGSKSSWIDHERCVGCGECVVACAYGAIKIHWESDVESFQERIVEHAAGALANKRDKTVFLSFITNVSPDCDCYEMSDASIVSDIGVLAARDVVAIDQAAYDLVTQAPGLPGTKGEGLDAGEDKFLAVQGMEGTHAMVYAESMGLGTRHYELKTVG